jgi:FAD/FMN-containing dehydrogenase
MSSMTAARFELPGFSGMLIHPQDDAFEEARQVFNGMIDRRPALIARCTSDDDVVHAVQFARDRGLPLSVYGGGHAVTGSAMCEAGVCVDMRGMRGIAVDLVARTVRAEGGVNWGEFDAATQAHGLAVTGGRNPTTGIAGLTLGSGSGWLERKLGFACDSLFKVELVVADGRKVIASEEENPELFWGLRGGGGNFGVATAFHFRLHHIGPMVLGGLLLYPAPMARDVVRNYRDFMATAPDEIGGAMVFLTAPPADFVPEPARGQPMLGVVICYAGPIEEGEAALRSLRAFGPPVADLVQPMPYLAVQKLTEAGNPPGIRNYWTADFMTGLPDDAIDALVGIATKPVSPMTSIIVVPGGGAPSRVDEDATAFGQRKAPWNIHYLSTWFEPAEDERNISYTRALSGAMKPWATGRVYLNYIGDEGQSRVEASFGPVKYARLQAIKREWDPQNLFRHNQNITPGEA